MKFEIYRSGLIRSEWRWRLRAQNGRTIADSGEGYRQLEDAKHGVELVQRSSEARVIVKGAE